MALPEGLQFLQAGWWLLHAVTIWFVWQAGYPRGRDDEKRVQRGRESEQGKR